MRPGPPLVALVALVACWGGVATAQPAEVPPETQAAPAVWERLPVPGDPHGRHGTWELPRPAIQAEMDPRMEPPATGVIFVPAMTDPVLEPSYLVLEDDGTDSWTTPMGRKTFVPPGRYTVIVGSGPLDQRLEFEATVVEGRVTWIPVEWSGLVVNVVDETGSPFRGGYEVVRLPEREYAGLGLGAAIAEGERLTTWVMRPGTYMLLVAGESYQARRNFVTLRLAPGELLHYTLVLSSESGDLLGAGEIASFRPQQRTTGWNLSLVVGGSFDLSESSRVIGKSDGTSVGLSGFVESLFGYLGEVDRFYGRLNLTAGGTFRLPDQPFVSRVDELSLDLLYVYRLAPWFGPYARASVETQVLPGRQLFEQPTDVRRLDREGRELGVSRGVTSFTLAHPLMPVEPRYATGLRFDLRAGRTLSLATRIGVGGRHVFTRGLFILADDPETPELEVRQVADIDQFGAELALVAELNLGRWVVLKVDTSVLIPFSGAEETFVDLRGSAILRLTTFASLNYTLRVRHDPALSADTQLDHQVLLRFAYKLF